MSDEQYVNQGVKDYYQKQSLSSEKLQQLIDIAEVKQNDEQQTRFQSDRWKNRLQLQRNVAVAASLLLASIISLQWLAPAPTQRELIAGIAEEIAINHQKQFAIEFPGNHYAQLGSAMNKLDFTLIDPVRLKERGLKILGARYCSLQGQIAAQIRLRDNSGEVFTLYQTASAVDLKKLAEQQQLVNGIEIEMWNEDGVFLGLAG